MESTTQQGLESRQEGLLGRNHGGNGRQADRSALAEKIAGLRKTERQPNQGTIDWEEEAVETFKTAGGQVLSAELVKKEKGLVTTEDEARLVREFEENVAGTNKTEKTSEDIVKEEFETLPQADKEKVALGLHNIGFLVEEKKNQLFASGFDKARQLGLSKGWLKENGSFDRWLLSFSENMTKNAEESHKKMEEANRTSLNQLTSIGSVTGNAMKYGRVFTDLFGPTIASPLRYVMMGGMLFGQGAAAAKEARFKNEEVLEKTRVQDINTAAEEAWRIYEQAKGNKDTISKEDLEKAYLDNAPKDLLNRLKKDPEPGTASSILQKIIRKDVELSVESINKKLTIVEEDYNLSEIDKKIEREKILQKYSQHIKDLDRAVSQFGTVDALALGAKYGETAAKTVVYGMMVETLVLSIDKLWEKLPSIFGGMMSTASAAEMPVLGKMEGASAVCNISDYEAAGKVDGGILELATIHEGEGITHALSRQLMNNPEDFGFKGDTSDTKAVEKWAVAESYRIAIKAGYVDIESGKEVRVGSAGINKVAYLLEKDSSGNLKIEEQLKGSDGKFQLHETHDVAKNFKDAKFEGGSKNTYEYEQSNVHTPGTEVSDVLSTTTENAEPRDVLMEESITAAEPKDVLMEGYIPETAPKDVLMEGYIPAEIMPKDPKILMYADQYINKQINGLFGSKGIFGLGAKAGIDSIDWKDSKVGFGSKTVAQILNAKPSAFPEDGARHFGIENYSATGKMQDYINVAIKETGVAPLEKESAGDYLKRAAAIAISKSASKGELSNLEELKAEQTPAGPPLKESQSVWRGRAHLGTEAGETGKVEPKTQDSQSTFRARAHIGTEQAGTTGSNEPNQGFDKSENTLTTAPKEAIVAEILSPNKVEHTEALTKRSESLETEQMPSSRVLGITTEPGVTGTTVELKGTTGNEFLSKDYASKLKPSGAGFSFDRTMAAATSRDISARLAAYNQLIAAGKTDEAAQHLSGIYKTIEMAEESLGQGVIDKSNIPKQI